MGKKSVIISAGISVALFATVLTVSLVNNTRTNEKLDSNISDVKKDNETLKNETQANLTALEGKLTDAKTALEAADKKLTEADAAMKAELEKSIKDAQATIKETTDALATVDTKLTADLADTLAKVTKNISDITAANKSIEDAKTELTTAINEAKAASTKAVNDLKKSTEDSVKELGDVLDELLLDYDELNTNVNKKLDVTAFNTFKTTVETFKAEYDATAATVNTLKETIENMATAESVATLKTTVDGLTTTVNTMNGTLTTLNTGLTELKGLVNANTSNIDDLSTRVTSIASVVSDAARTTKVAKVNALYDNYYTLRDKMEAGMDSVISMPGTFKIDGEVLDENLKIKQLRNLEKALNTGLMNLALSDVNNVDAVIEEVNANMAAVAEKVNIVCEKAAFAGAFADYKTETINKIKALENIADEAKTTLVAEVNDYNPEVDYDSLGSTAEVSAKLASLKFDVYKIFVKGELADTKLAAVKLVDEAAAAVPTMEAEYVTSVKDAINGVTVTSEATTQEEFDVVKNNQYNVIAKTVELALVKGSEIEEVEAYKADLDSWVAAGNLTAEKREEALAAIDVILAKYDYTIGGVTYTGVVLDTEKTVADVTSVFVAEKAELEASKEIYADIAELDREQKNADAEFTALKAKLAKVIDGTSEETVVVDENNKFEGKTAFFNATEKAHYVAMLNSITMKPASEMTDLDEIRTEKARVHALVSNVTKLALAYDNVLTKTVRTAGDTFEIANAATTNALNHVSTGSFVSYFSTTEVNNMKNEAAAIAKTVSFDIVGFEELDDAGKAAALAALTADKIENDTATFDAAVTDFTTKYDFVLEGRVFKQDAIKNVNTNIGAILGDYVKNNYGIEFETIELFEATSSETSAQVKTRLEEYKGRVSEINGEATKLAEALQNKDAHVTDIKSNLVEAGTYLDSGFTAGLSATERDNFVGKLEAVGNATSLYIQLQNGTENPIEAYTAEVDKLHQEAKDLFAVKGAAYAQDVALRESLTAFENHYKADFTGTAADLSVPELDGKFAKFTAEQWTNYTNTVDGFYTTYRSYLDGETTTAKTEANKTAFDAAFATWKAKVIADFKTLDKTFLNNRWYEYGIDSTYSFAEGVYDGRVNANSNIEVIYKNARDRYLSYGVNGTLLTMLAEARTNLSKAEFSFAAYRNYTAEVSKLAKYMVSIDTDLTTEADAMNIINGWLATVTA